MEIKCKNAQFIYTDDTDCMIDVEGVINIDDVSDADLFELVKAVSVSKYRERTLTFIAVLFTKDEILAAKAPTGKS